MSGKMLILAIDTSLKNGSVCLARGDADSCEIIGIAEVDGGMFSAQLVPVIAALLKKHNLHKENLDGIAAAVGPGSFTGLRIGLAAVKGFAEVLKIPVATVSTLHAVAAMAKSQGRPIMAVLDAGRKEFYVRESLGGESQSEHLWTSVEFAAELGKRKDATVVSADAGAWELAKSAGNPVEQVSYPGAEIVAKLGLQKLAAGEIVTVDQLDANYVRRDEGLFSVGK